MSLVGGRAMVVPRQGRKEVAYPVDTGPTEDAASGRPARGRRLRLRFVRPS